MLQPLAGAGHGAQNHVPQGFCHLQQALIMQRLQFMTPAWHPAVQPANTSLSHE
jgi:hypothetical protein